MSYSYKEHVSLEQINTYQLDTIREKSVPINILARQ